MASIFSPSRTKSIFFGGVRTGQRRRGPSRTTGLLPERSVEELAQQAQVIPQSMGGKVVDDSPGSQDGGVR